MTRIPSTLSSTASQPFSSADAINDIELGTFLKLMITELQNQDPLNPLDNKDMLAQISQIREVAATDNLTETLESVLLGQNIASATNLIGADITALSDDGEPVIGQVNHVSIEKGVPKLHVDLEPEAVASDQVGNVDAGTYAYRVVWQEGDKLFGIEFSGSDAVTTTGTEEVDQSILIRHLPKTSVPKHIYRTDASGEGPYKLVGILTNGAQGSFIDVLADDERSETTLTQSFRPLPSVARSYQVGLNNVSGIRPPNLANSQVAANPLTTND
jgi:flagellar basal-body rod modification protein FlgD